MKGNVMDLQGEGWKVLAGSCLDRLPELADESVDAVVCDPPYELGFMGKSWDSSGIAYDVNVWRECLRVLKPGGHILAFGGSRTWHRLAVAVEDAGFELRDSIAWLYGSGFPKSLDISKAIDKKRNDSEAISTVARRMRELLQLSGKSKSELDEIFGTKNVAQYWFSPDRNAQIVPAGRWPIVRDWLGAGDELDSEVWRLNGRKGQPGEAWSEREVIGQKTGTKSVDGGGHGIVPGGITETVKLDVTAPATAEAVKWAGWGTALKPAFEPVVVGRKPLKGTVAANVLAYGVGGLNIDGTRIGRKNGDVSSAGNRTATFGTQETASGGDGSGGGTQNDSGRWPSNVILDEYTAQLVDQQSGESKSPNKPVTQGGKEFGMGGERGRMRDGLGVGYGDNGGASRFFYIAKANKRDRNEGLDGLEEVEAKRTHSGGEDTRGRPIPKNRNIHPTVKPTDLMRQLIRLVTPPGGIVLDPFTGSGSTGKAAILEGMQFIGCELTEDYLPIIEGRINWAVEQVKQDKLKAEQESAEVLF